MPVSDPIADMLTSIRNAVIAKHRRVDVPASRTKAAIADALIREKYINNVRKIEDTKQGVLRIYLKYVDGATPVLKGLKRVSTPGRRVYVKKDEIPRVLGGLGTTIISSSKGILTDKEARDLDVGGEVLAQVW